MRCLADANCADCLSHSEGRVLRLPVGERQQTLVPAHYRPEPIEQRRLALRLLALQLLAGSWGRLGLLGPEFGRLHLVVATQSRLRLGARLLLGAHKSELPGGERRAWGHQLAGANIVGLLAGACLLVLHCAHCVHHQVSAT